MKMFIIGFVTCLIVTSVGFAGIAKIGDNLMNKGQSMVKEAAQ
jgi:UDP-3-O-[3-hydroxymyristoyl] glucosamine N-acyltransferase